MPDRASITARLRVRVVVGLLVAAVSAIGITACSSGESDQPAVAAKAPAVPRQSPDPRLALVSERTLSPRLTELTLRTPALPDETKVRVLLPADYATSGKHYPVLYLFPGGLSDASAWITPQAGAAVGGAEPATAGLPLIVVMPEIGRADFCVDWFNEGKFGPPMWETYHINQLLPWVDGHYRTVADRMGRATAGFSLGGHCSVSYAARHPDLFGATASFSGSVNNLLTEGEGNLGGFKRS